jgi:hypothetical protein
MKQELHSGPKKNMRSRSKFNGEGNLAPAIYARLLQVFFNHKGIPNVILGIKPCTVFGPVTSQRGDTCNQQ